MRVLSFLLLFFYVQIHRSQTDDHYNSFFRIGAVLNAANFNKHLHYEVRRHLHVPKINKLLSLLKTKTLIYDIPLLEELSNLLDFSFANISNSLLSLDSASSSLSYHATSCNTVLEAIWVNRKQVCSIPYSYPKVVRHSSVLIPNLSKSIYRRQFAYHNHFQYEYPSEFLSVHSKLHWTAILRERLGIKRRNIVILLDIGSISLDSQLENIRSAARHLIDVALPSDHYAILTVDSKEVIESCSEDNLNYSEVKFSKINNRNIKLLNARIDEISWRKNNNSNSSSSHAFALEKAYELLAKQNQLLYPSNIIHYISRGTLEELSDASNVMRHLATVIVQYKIYVKINTLIATDGTGNPLLWPAEFMESIARQNFSRYRYSLNETLEHELNNMKYKPIQGVSILLNKPMPLSLSLSQIENLLRIGDSSENQPTEASWHIQPKPYGKDDESTATVTHTVVDERGSLIFGIDVSLTELSWKIFSHPYIAYAPPSVELEVFLTVEQGYIVASSSGYNNLHIYEADDWQTSSRWLLDTTFNEQGDMEVLNRSNKKLFYFWKKLKTKPFVLFIRTIKTSFPFHTSIPSGQDGLSFETQDHIVLNHRSKMSQGLCSFNSEGFNFNFATLFLPHWIYPYGREPVHRSSFQFSSDTDGYEDTELDHELRLEIDILAHISRIWTKDIDTQTSPIIRRFIASRRGIMSIFPATNMDSQFDPLKQKWYREALKNDGNLIVTGPYLKPKLGEVVILSQSVHLSSNNSTIAVIGMEVATSYFRLLLLDSLPICAQNRRCVLFSSFGSVIFANEDSDNARAPSDVLERFHISHLEPMLTSQIIRDSSLVRRARCRTDSGIQRYLELQTFNKRVHSSPCDTKSEQSSGNAVQHEIIGLTQSNLYIALINTTCNRASAKVFCPCSVNDHRCLICGRYSEHECECPCECSLNRSCSSATDIEETIPYCSPKSREDTFALEFLNGQKCEETECSTLLHISSCLATVGCGWCEFDTKGNRLPIGNCMPISMCYQGVQGRTTFQSMDRFEQWGLSAPFGPFAAGILTVFFVIALLFYCYQTQVATLATRRSLSDGAPLFNGQTNFDIEFDGTVFKEEKQTVQLASFEREAPPPQEPNRHVESDHGYSTMTDRNTINEETESSTSVSTDRPRLSYKVLNREKATSTVITTAAIVHPVPHISLVS